jgi:hypothetical protein
VLCCAQLRNPLHQILALLDFVFESRRRQGLDPEIEPPSPVETPKTHFAVNVSLVPESQPFTPSPATVLGVTAGPPLTLDSSAALPIGDASTANPNPNCKCPPTAPPACAAHNPMTPDAAGFTPNHSSAPPAFRPTQSESAATTAVAGHSSDATATLMALRRASSESFGSELHSLLHTPGGSLPRALLEAAVEDRAHLETIQSSALIMSTLLNDVLDMSKIEAGKMCFERYSQS